MDIGKTQQWPTIIAVYKYKKKNPKTLDRIIIIIIINEEEERNNYLII